MDADGFQVYVLRRLADLEEQLSKTVTVVGEKRPREEEPNEAEEFIMSLCPGAENLEQAKRMIQRGLTPSNGMVKILETLMEQYPEGIAAGAAAKLAKNGHTDPFAMRIFCLYLMEDRKHLKAPSPTILLPTSQEPELRRQLQASRDEISTLRSAINNSQDAQAELEQLRARLREQEEVTDHFKAAFLAEQQARERVGALWNRERVDDGRKRFQKLKTLSQDRHDPVRALETIEKILDDSRVFFTPPK